jgi:hypothetical protein
MVGEAPERPRRLSRDADVRTQISCVGLMRPPSRVHDVPAATRPYCVEFNSKHLLSAYERRRNRLARLQRLSPFFRGSQASRPAAAGLG